MRSTVGSCSSSCAPVASQRAERVRCQQVWHPVCLWFNYGKAYTRCILAKSVTLQQRCWRGRYVGKRQSVLFLSSIALRQHDIVWTKSLHSACMATNLMSPLLSHHITCSAIKCSWTHVYYVKRAPGCNSLRHSPLTKGWSQAFVRHIVVCRSCNVSYVKKM